jgi:hypothetical protein
MSHGQTSSVHSDLINPELLLILINPPNMLTMNNKKLSKYKNGLFLEL